MKIEWDMENSAFDENPNQELSKILAGLCRKIALAGPIKSLTSVSGRLVDSNNNTVGKWKVSMAEKEI